MFYFDIQYSFVYLGMQEREYLYVILYGYQEYYNYLPNYFFRESIKAKKAGINKTDFYNGLYFAINKLLNDIELQYNKEVEKIKIIKDIRLQNNQAINDIDDYLRPKEMFNAFLPRVTNNTFYGNLNYSEILYLKDCLNKSNIIRKNL